MSEAIRANLKNLSHALQSLHRDLLMLQARSLAQEDGKPVNPYELLRASLHDPEFSWLRKMSALIVHIDTIVDELENLSGRETNEIAGLVLALIEKPEPRLNQEFWNRYSSYLANDPNIILKHSKVKEILSALRPNL